VDLSEDHIILANPFVINVKIMAVHTEFQKEIIMKKLKKNETNKELVNKIDGEFDEVEKIYDDIEFDDSSEVDYGMEYTNSH
tara:strand:+ start:111 stop:356 length:246 start_codon:yes stop_codon:yes gene_type:complete